MYHWVPETTESLETEIASTPRLQTLHNCIALGRSGRYTHHRKTSGKQTQEYRHTFSTHKHSARSRELPLLSHKQGNHRKKKLQLAGAMHRFSISFFKVQYHTSGRDTRRKLVTSEQNEQIKKYAGSTSPPRKFVDGSWSRNPWDPPKPTTGYTCAVC